MKILIISQPKSGTYLLSNILKNLNFFQTGIHCSHKLNGRYKKYDLNLTDIKRQINKNNKNLINEISHNAGSFENLISLIPIDSFAVGHIPYTPLSVECLKKVKKILILRPYEEFLESRERFRKEHNSDVTIEKEFYINIENWKNEEDVFVIHFSDVINKNVEVIDDLQLFLLNKIKFNSRQIIELSLTENSLTKSSIR